MGKLLIDGEIADKEFPLRTTRRVFNLLIDVSGERQVSINHVINEALLAWEKKTLSQKDKEHTPLKRLKKSINPLKPHKP